MPKWIFQKISGDQQGVGSLVRNVKSKRKPNQLPRYSVLIFKTNHLEKYKNLARTVFTQISIFKTVKEISMCIIIHDSFGNLTYSVKKKFQSRSFQSL